MATKTITLTGAEVTVTGLDGSDAHIRNDGTGTIYAAKTTGIRVGADGVLSIPSGAAATITGISGRVSLLGTGSATIISNDYTTSPFKSSVTCGLVTEVAQKAAEAVLQAICPSNVFLYDNLNAPSVMVKIPKMTWAQLGVCDSDEVFPAFIVNGKVVDALYFPKFENVVINNRAYSLPTLDPSIYVNVDDSVRYSSNKGTGWHSLTRLEWCTIALWCLKNGFQPNGNNNLGKDVSENTYQAIPTAYQDNLGVIRTATGTGPLTWYHNNAPDGIADLNGNVWEITTGVRLVYGELQVLSRDGTTFGNDAADPANDQSANSSLWRAIDGTTGALITPDGTGTTTYSLKLDWVSGAWKWITGAITSASNSNRSSAFEDITVDTTVCEAAQRILQALCLYKTSSGDYNGDMFWARNAADDICFYAGGGANDNSGSGVFSIYAFAARTTKNSYVGCRSAYIELPT